MKTMMKTSSNTWGRTIQQATFHCNRGRESIGTVWVINCGGGRSRYGQSSTWNVKGGISSRRWQAGKDCRHAALNGTLTANMER
jgi:hypothetical protein